MKKEKKGLILIPGYLVINKLSNMGLGKDQKYICLDLKTNKKVFIKRSRNFKNLESEYVVQDFFYRELKKIRGENVIIPKPILLKHIDTKTFLISEFLNLKSILKMKKNMKAKIYSEVLSTLMKVKTITPDLKIEKVKKRGAAYLLITVPYFLIRDVINGMDIKTALRSLLGILSSTKSWFSLDYLRLSHGDINTTNIFVNGKKIVLLDFGEACISNKYFDASKAINSTWYEPEFSDTLLKNLFSKKIVREDEKKIFSSFAIYNLLQRLSIKTNAKKKKFYLNRLNEFITYAKNR